MRSCCVQVVFPDRHRNPVHVSVVINFVMWRGLLWFWAPADAPTAAAATALTRGPPPPEDAPGVQRFKKLKKRNAMMLVMRMNVMNANTISTHLRAAAALANSNANSNSKQGWVKVVRGGLTSSATRRAHNAAHDRTCLFRHPVHSLCLCDATPRGLPPPPPPQPSPHPPTTTACACNTRTAPP